MMRMVLGSALIQQSIVKFHGPAFDTRLVAFLMGATAMLLFLGLWTPIGCVVATAVELWSVFSESGDTRIYVLLAALCAALALLGPGAWSIDARLFGWKRIDIRDRKS